MNIRARRLRLATARAMTAILLGTPLTALCEQCFAIAPTGTIRHHAAMGEHCDKDRGGVRDSKPVTAPGGKACPCGSYVTVSHREAPVALTSAAGGPDLSGIPTRNLNNLVAEEPPRCRAPEDPPARALLSPITHYCIRIE